MSVCLAQVCLHRALNLHLSGSLYQNSEFTSCFYIYHTIHLSATVSPLAQADEGPHVVVIGDDGEPVAASAGVLRDSEAVDSVT